MGDFFIGLGKFILGAILKILVVTLVILLVWLAVCVVIHNGFKEGLTGFLGSKVLIFILAWLLLTWELLSRGDIQGVVFGVLLFFAPIILLAFSTPNPPIELYDDQGNLWTLTKN